MRRGWGLGLGWVFGRCFLPSSRQKLEAQQITSANPTLVPQSPSSPFSQYLLPHSLHRLLWVLNVHSVKQGGNEAFSASSRSWGLGAFQGLSPKPLSPSSSKNKAQSPTGKNKQQSYSLTIKLMLLLRKLPIVVIFLLPGFPFPFGCYSTWPWNTIRKRE